MYVYARALALDLDPSFFTAARGVFMTAAVSAFAPASPRLPDVASAVEAGVNDGAVDDGGDGVDEGHHRLLQQVGGHVELVDAAEAEEVAALSAAIFD